VIILNKSAKCYPPIPTVRNDEYVTIIFIAKKNKLRIVGINGYISPNEITKFQKELKECAKQLKLNGTYLAECKDYYIEDEPIYIRLVQSLDK